MQKKWRNTGEEAYIVVLLIREITSDVNGMAFHQHFFQAKGINLAFSSYCYYCLSIVEQEFLSKFAVLIWSVVEIDFSNEKLY